MQHYMCFGYGFLSIKLTKKEFKNVEEKILADDEIGAALIPYRTENVSHDGSILLLERIKEISNKSKAISLSELNKEIAQYGVIPSQTRKMFSEILNELEIPHLIDSVELILYSETPYLIDSNNLINDSDYY